MNHFSAFGLLSIFMMLPSDLHPQPSGGDPSKIDVPGEWRKLESEYRGKIDQMKKEREARGEEIKTAKDKLDSIDLAKISDQAKEEMDDAFADMGESLGSAFFDYFKGRGGPYGSVEAGLELLNPDGGAIASLGKAYDAAFAELDAEFEIDQIEAEIARMERENRKLDSNLEFLEKEAELSRRIAELYELEDQKTRREVRVTIGEVKIITMDSRESVKEKSETVPDGWVECQCPHDHNHQGRKINGKLYHPGGLSCPATSPPP